MSGVLGKLHRRMLRQLCSFLRLLSPFEFPIGAWIFILTFCANLVERHADGGIAFGLPHNGVPPLNSGAALPCILGNFVNPRNRSETLCDVHDGINGRAVHRMRISMYPASARQVLSLRRLTCVFRVPFFSSCFLFFATLPPFLCLIAVKFCGTQLRVCVKNAA